MMQTRDPLSPWFGWATERWTTPFSGFRWGVPAACDYQGKAIYTDSDVIFMDDIAKLHRQEFGPGKVVMGKGFPSRRICVALWDCAAAQKVLPPIDQIKKDPMSHNQISHKFLKSGWIQNYEGNWNCLDGEDYADLHHPDIKAIHYTEINCQVHLKHAIPRLREAGKPHWYNGPVKPHPRKDLQALFDYLLAEARDAGYPAERYVPAKEYGAYKKRDLSKYKGRVDK